MNAKESAVLEILDGLRAYNPRGMVTIGRNLMSFDSALGKARALLTGEAIAKGARCPRCRRKAPKLAGCALCNPGPLKERGILE